MTEGMPPTPEEARQLRRRLNEQVLEQAAADPQWKQRFLDDPRAAISVGDAVHPAGWPKQGPSSYLRATGVHHCLGESAGQVRHLVTVYTEEAGLD